MDSNSQTTPATLSPLRYPLPRPRRTRFAYGTGAATASFVFFFALGYGASLLAPQMQRPNAWRVLDTIIAVVMFALAIGMARAGGWLGA